MNDDGPSILFLAVKQGLTVIKNVISKTRYVITYDKVNDDIDPVGEKLREDTTYDIKRGDTYLYRALSYDEMEIRLHELLNE